MQIHRGRRTGEGARCSTIARTSSFRQRKLKGLAHKAECSMAARPSPAHGAAPARGVTAAASAGTPVRFQNDLREGSERISGTGFTSGPPHWIQLASLTVAGATRRYSMHLSWNMHHHPRASISTTAITSISSQPPRTRQARPAKLFGSFERGRAALHPKERALHRPKRVGSCQNHTKA